MGLSIEDLYTVRGNILLLGETGSGKSHIAAQIHANSLWRNQPFLILNLATIVEDLLESELFGHVKGAFTGAMQDKRGFAENVGAGTLFLDEVGELSLKAQKKLLLLLEERRFIPVGDTTIKEFKGRIIAASNKNLKEMVQKGKFREDLYYRLRIFSHYINPVREDRVRLETLIDDFLVLSMKKLGKDSLYLTAKCRKILLDYPWPGNIREIKNSVEYMVTMASKEAIDQDLLPEWIRAYSPEINICLSPMPLLTEHGNNFNSSLMPLDYNLAMEQFEAAYLTFVLEKFHGRVNFTANKLKISKSTLIAKARKYGINTMLLRAMENH